ncbi:MAG: protoporphyrinogen oxidase HemJ [Rhodobiaceae bacterium]|nr:protoporphyrinogen oxidase HemJ [Rhodobiaceae bacterium]
MTELLNQYYEWIKAFHIISVIFWMAGMFYLPRLYVYHAEVPVGSDLSENFKKMEVLLLRRIINPAMGAAFLFGGLLLWMLWDVYSSDAWLHIKLLAVLVMSAYHGFLARWRKAFDQDERPLTSRQLRLLNEVPPVLTIIIVIMVVVKPF